MSLDDGRVLRCGSEGERYSCDPGLDEFFVHLDGRVGGFYLSVAPLPTSLRARVLYGERVLGEATLRPIYEDFPSENGEECPPCHAARALEMPLDPEVSDGG